jgi:Mn-dependent DtxR family transcriptional regulator
MQALRFIYDYIKNNDSAPSLKEIAEALGISVAGASYLMHPLCGQDYLTRPAIRQWARYIALTEKGISACEGDE